MLLSNEVSSVALYFYPGLSDERISSVAPWGRDVVGAVCGRYVGISELTTHVPAPHAQQETWWAGKSDGR